MAQQIRGTAARKGKAPRDAAAPGTLGYVQIMAKRRNSNGRTSQHTAAAQEGLGDDALQLRHATAPCEQNLHGAGALVCLKGPQQGESNLDELVQLLLHRAGQKEAQALLTLGYDWYGTEWGDEAPWTPTSNRQAKEPAAWTYARLPLWRPCQQQEAPLLTLRAER